MPEKNYQSSSKRPLKNEALKSHFDCLSLFIKMFIWQCKTKAFHTHVAKLSCDQRHTRFILLPSPRQLLGSHNSSQTLKMSVKVTYLAWMTSCVITHQLESINKKKRNWEWSITERAVTLELFLGKNQIFDRCTSWSIASLASSRFLYQPYAAIHVSMLFLTF